MRVPNRDPDKEEESGFRVTDRRRRGADASPDVERAAEPRSEKKPDPHPPQAEAPQAEAPPTELIPTPDLVRIFIAELQTRALLHLGLIPNPATRLVTKDLGEARLAIDTVAALVAQLNPLASPAERDQLQEMLANLRMHFVRQSGG